MPAAGGGHGYQSPQVPPPPSFRATWTLRDPRDRCPIRIERTVPESSCEAPVASSIHRDIRDSLVFPHIAALMRATRCDNLAADDFEKNPMPTSAEIIARRLHIPGVLDVRIGIAAIQQLIQECQNHAALLGAGPFESRRRQA